MILTLKVDELMYLDTPQILEQTPSTVSVDVSYSHSRSQYLEDKERSRHVASYSLCYRFVLDRKSVV